VAREIADVFQTVADAHATIAKLPRGFEYIGLIIMSDEFFKEEHSEPNEIDRIRARCGPGRSLSREEAERIKTEQDRAEFERAIAAARKRLREK
jgi:hypothetical protein